MAGGVVRNFIFLNFINEIEAFMVIRAEGLSAAGDEELIK